MAGSYSDAATSGAPQGWRTGKCAITKSPGAILNLRSTARSMLSGQDTEDSDLDILVEPTEETTMFDIAKIQLELSQLLNIGIGAQCTAGKISSMSVG
jgi:hypothetical protein